MAKRLLLARPHPFIVSEMKPFLEMAGYQVHKLEDQTELPGNARSSVGAIISLAVTSSISASAEEIFLQLRQATPHLPVLFAAMSPLEKLQVSLERIAKNAGITAHILGLEATDTSNQLCGLPTTFLFISKDDLLDGERRKLALNAVKRHFG